MGDPGDFWYGVFKPIKDACTAVVSTSLFLTLSDTALKNTTEILGLPFNIYIYTTFFSFIVFADDTLSSLIYDFKSSYHEPFDTFLRLLGILVGMVFFAGPLSILYMLSGGSFGEAIISWIVSFVVLIISTFVRLYIKGHY